MSNKVMLVEDDATMRSLLKTLLEIEKFHVVAPDAHVADILSLIRLEQPQVVLLDVHLRAPNGDEINSIPLLEELRRDDTLKNVRVLMTSGMPLQDECIKAGADGFLQKPYMPAELLNMIHKQINP